MTDSLGREVIIPLNRMPSGRNPTTKAGESFDWGPWNVPDSDFGDTKITEWAIGQLKKECDKPLFLALGYSRPHIPLWAPARFFERFKEEPGKLPPIKEDDLDGESLVPLLRDPSKVTGRRLITVFNPGNHSVRTERWRYLLYADGSQELYDHESDPNEWSNLAGNPEYSAVIKQLRGDL